MVQQTHRKNNVHKIATHSLQAPVLTVVVAVILTIFALGAMPAAAQAFNVVVAIPYAQDSRIADNIVTECTQLGTKLSTFLVKFAKKRGIEVTPVDELKADGPGRNLVIEITDAVSRGNAFTGHRKFMEARAELFVDGVSKGEKTYQRDSMGGFGAGYKGSCSVLGRNSKALGKDFSVWLKELETAGL